MVWYTQLLALPSHVSPLPLRKARMLVSFVPPCRFDEYFPLAHAVGSELDTWTNSTARLHFTAQSWLVSLYLDCPTNMGLHCPNASALAMFNDSVAKGYITWHAFPFNAQPEFMDPSLIGFGVDLTHQLDARFGVPNKTTMSQRDVPGMSRSIIPVLRQHGVSTISVGVNGGSTPPNVPSAFVWQDPVSGQSVNALYLNGGYGGFDLFWKYRPTIIPGLQHAMIVAWCGVVCDAVVVAADGCSDSVCVLR